MVNLPGKAEIVDLKRLSPKLRTDEFYFQDWKESLGFLSGIIRESKLTQKDIAERAGCCAATVSHFVHKTTKSPHHRTVISVFNALGWELMARK